MKAPGQKKNLAVPLFILGFLVGGILHFFDRLLIYSLLSPDSAERSAGAAFGSTVLFILNLAVYVFLIVWWSLSLHSRLLPSRGRTYLILAAAFMLFFLLERAVKYRLAENGTVLEHVCWYLYYIPLAMIPAMFLLTCLCTLQNPVLQRNLRYTVWGVSLLLVFGVLTNDLHYLMFRPLREIQNGAWGTYVNGPLWYIFYIYISLCILAGLCLLGGADRRRGRGLRTLVPALLTILMFAVMLLADRIFYKGAISFPWAFPELSIFCMLSIFECCIRNRLIPYNENYAGFFAQLRLPAEITDRSFSGVYGTAVTLCASIEQKRESLRSPVALGDHERLRGKELPSGYAFWVSDESVIRRLNEELANAAETLESENDLLAYENRQREERARVDARNCVYSSAAAEVYETQKKISQLLSEAKPGSPGFRERLSRILLLDAYVKRKTNLALLSSEKGAVPARELYLALGESARFLSLCGVDASAECTAGRDFPYKEAAALYDAFEALIEHLPDSAHALFVTLTNDALNVMTDCDRAFPIPRGNAEIVMRSEDGQLYISVRAREGGTL